MTLFQVPREIREAILEFVLLGNFPNAPIDASAATEGLRALPPVDLGSHADEIRSPPRRALHRDQPGGYACNSHRFLDTRCFMSGSSDLAGSGDLPVFYQTIENPALPLLLVCHQLHDEVQDVVARWLRTNMNTKQQQQLEYTADVMFVNNVGLWTTWLSVPVRTVCVDVLTANFRLFGPPRDLARGIYKRDMWEGGGGANMMTLATGTPAWSSNTSNGAWGFYDLLNGLLEGNIGPWPKKAPTTATSTKTSRLESSGTTSLWARNDGVGQQPQHSTLRVKRLILNITSALSANSSDVLSLSEIDKWASTSQLPTTFLPPPPLSSSSSSPFDSTSNQKVAAFTFARLVQFLLSILQSPIHQRVYGENLFDRVGVVEVQVDGERYGSEADLSKSLVDSGWLAVEEEENAGIVNPFREELVAELLEWQARTAERRRLAGFGTVAMVMT